MANLGRKGKTYVSRFRFDGKEYKKSLKTEVLADAQATMKCIERTIHGLTTGMILVPEGVDPGDFIVSCGTIREAAKPRRRAPPISSLINEYLANLSHKAPSTIYTEGVHLRNFKAWLGKRADAPTDRIEARVLEQYLQARLKERTPSTVHKERDTLGQLFKWAVAHGYLDASPATGLTAIKEQVELPPFRTISEIESILSRGGLSETEAADVWNCLYLSPTEITGLLRTVREQATADYAYLLHAVPAFTGMRRGEILRLRWADVELEPGHIIARSRKQSRRAIETARRIELHPQLATELRAWRERRPAGQFVLCEPGSLDALGSDLANRSFWQPMRGTAWCLNGKKNWFKIGLHTYRHSFASNLAAAGVDQRVIDEFMDHTTEAMRKRYRHLFPKDRRSAIESLRFGEEGTTR